MGHFIRIRWWISNNDKYLLLLHYNLNHARLYCLQYCLVFDIRTFQQLIWPQLCSMFSCRQQNCDAAWSLESLTDALQTRSTSRCLWRSVIYAGYIVWLRHIFPFHVCLQYTSIHIVVWLICFVKNYMHIGCTTIILQLGIKAHHFLVHWKLRIAQRKTNTVQ